MRLQNCLIDLHVHMDGSLSVDTARVLSNMQGIAVGDDAALRRGLQVSSDCHDLNEYLEKFDFPLSLLQTPAALSECVYRELCEQAVQGIIYSEIRFAPQLHTRMGMCQEDAVQACVQGLQRFLAESQQRSTKDSGCRHFVQAQLLLCCMRGPDNERANLETVELAARYRKKGVAAIDLAGAEALYPTSDFASVFACARKSGIPFTIHAGEAAGPESIARAVEFGASRIGHGIRAVEDKNVMRMLAERNVTLELCPTSNLNTKAVASIAAYPIRTLLAAGVRVTVNTDNMSVSNTTVEKELQLLADTFDFSEREIKALLMNAADAAFTLEATKRRLREKIEEQYALYCD